MRDSLEGETPVLVVGGRVTGLVMASELARHGIAVRIIDLSPGIDPHSRATFLHSRSLEIFAALGLAQDIVERSQPLHGVCVYSNGRFAGRAEQLPVDSPFPHTIALSQAKIEALLERHLNGLGVTVERSTKLSAMEHTADGVAAVLQHSDGGIETCYTPWLIGCDGAHSTVRHLMGESFPGEASPFGYMLADVAIDGPLDPSDAYMCLSDEGELFLFNLDEGRRLVVANREIGSDLCQPPSLAEIQEAVARRGIPDLHLSDPRWLSHFHIHYRLAPHYRQRHAFLAGDAAHVNSLIGGQGMNTGIQDAFNLAWKLALVMRGLAPQSWLDSYEMERRQVAEEVIKTTMAVTDEAELFSSLSEEERKKIVAHMFIPESERMRSRRHLEEIDLDYGDSPLCLGGAVGFAGGPPAGAQCVDTTGLFIDGQEGSFFDLLCRTKHLLILFASPPLEGSLLDIVEAVLRSDGHWIDVLVAMPRGPKAGLPAEVAVIEDPQGALFRRYGIETGGLYLIRPDGYVAYRSPRLDGLRDYLTRVF